MYFEIPFLTAYYRSGKKIPHPVFQISELHLNIKNCIKFYASRKCYFIKVWKTFLKQYFLLKAFYILLVHKTWIYRVFITDMLRTWSYVRVIWYFYKIHTNIHYIHAKYLKIFFHDGLLNLNHHLQNVFIHGQVETCIIKSHIITRRITRFSNESTHLSSNILIPFLHENK